MNALHVLTVILFQLKWTLLVQTLEMCRILQGIYAAAAAAKLLQSGPTLRDPIDGSPPGSPVPGILQARTLVAISFSNVWKWKVKVKSLSRVRLLATPWTVAYQAPPPMGFSRQEYWSGLPFPSPGDLPDPGIKPRSPTLQTLSHQRAQVNKPRKKIITDYDTNN